MIAYLLSFWVGGMMGSVILVQGIESEKACHEIFAVLKQQHHYPRDEHECIPYRMAVK